MSNYKASRKELAVEGAHFLLSDALVKEASNLFKISGIPHYAIIGKDGAIVEQQAKGPEEVYEQLLKLAN